MRSDEEQRGMFITRVGLVCGPSGDGWEGEATPNEDLVVPGTDRIRTSILVCWADVIAGGQANAREDGRVALTVDLAVHLVGTPTLGPVRLWSRPLKVGRSLVVSEVGMAHAGSEEPFAVAHCSFQGSPRPEDVMPPDFVAGRHARSGGTFGMPLVEAMEVTMVGPGTAEMERRPFVMNPAGTIQGGAVAILAEAAAEDAAGGPIADMEIRYLRTTRVGPGRATATRIGPGLIRVELRDPGAGDRLTGLVLARPA